MKRKRKICMVVSAGGHLYQAYVLGRWWRRFDRLWVVIPGPDSRYLLRNETVTAAHGPENRNLFNLLRNTALAFSIITRDRPNIIFSTGAAVCVPFMILGKLLRIKTVYLEPFDFIDRPSLTARLVAPFTDVLLVQHRELVPMVPHAVYGGSIL